MLAYQLPALTLKMDMNDSAKEMEFLESVTHTYVTSDSPQDRLIKTLAVRVFTPFLRRDAVAAEMGCCDGFMTQLLAREVEHLDVVDGSQTFLDLTRKRDIPNVSFHHSLFEEYDRPQSYDFVFATYVLEHVADPQVFLQRIGTLLKPGGLLFLVVPNARALSRQLARHMGLLETLHTLTPNDLNHGHRRVYDRISLNRELDTAGMIQVSQGGLLLKILADFQMDRLINDGVLGHEQLDGLFKLGLEYPDMAGSLFSICRLKNR